MARSLLLLAVWFETDANFELGNNFQFNHVSSVPNTISSVNLLFWLYQFLNGCTSTALAERFSATQLLNREHIVQCDQGTAEKQL